MADSLPILVPVGPAVAPHIVITNNIIIIIVKIMMMVMVLIMMIIIIIILIMRLIVMMMMMRRRRRRWSMVRKLSVDLAPLTLQMNSNSLQKYVKVIHFK